MSYDVVRTVENDTYRLLILHDECADDPREWCNLGRMICWHRRYKLGDKHNYDTPEDFLRDLARKIVGDSGTDELDEMSDKEIEGFVMCSSKVAILPLYMMDHSGLYLSTSPEQFYAMDPYGFDWGQIGWIYVTLNDARRSGIDGTDEEVRSKALDILAAEVEVYGRYISGDVYGYILEKKLKCESCGTVKYERVDSCFGIYGYDEVKGSLKDYLTDDYGDLAASL